MPTPTGTIMREFIAEVELKRKTDYDNSQAELDNIWSDGEEVDEETTEYNCDYESDVMERMEHRALMSFVSYITLFRPLFSKKWGLRMVEFKYDEDRCEWGDMTLLGYKC